MDSKLATLEIYSPNNYGKHYISTIDANTYAPDVYGWEVVA